MGKYIRKAGGVPGYPLFELLKKLESLLMRYAPMNEIIKLQEEIEDVADDMDVTIMWMDGVRYPVVRLYGQWFGEFHMTRLLHRRDSQAVTKKV